MNRVEATSSLKRIGFSLVAFALAWMAVELVTLAYWWLRPPPPGRRMQAFYQAHPYRALVPAPNTIDGMGMRSFNSLGLRGHEVAVAPSPKTVRIVCLGASTTFSSEATTDSHAYPARMEALLRTHYRDASFHIEVLNAGVEASVMPETLIYLQTRILDLSPDVAILHQGLNEAWLMIGFRDFQSDYSHARRTFTLPPRKWWEYSPFLSSRFAPNSPNNPYFPARSVDIFRFTVDQSRAGSVEIIEPKMVAAFERNVRTFVALARGNDMIPVLSTQVFHLDLPFFRPWLQMVARLNQSIRDIAAEESVALIDFARSVTWNKEDFADSCHLKDTPGGLGRKARIFADHLIRYRLVEQAAQRGESKKQ